MTTDDWPPPTGEHEPAATHASIDRSRPAEDDCIDPVLGISERDLLLVEAFYHNLGMQASEDPSPPTREEQDSIDWLGAQFERLKAMSDDELAALAEERAKRLR